MASPAALLERRHWFLLWVLGAATFFEGYDLYVIVVALPQLRADFGLSQSTASLWIALVYAGALPAFWLTRRADRFGRRRLLLVSITGYTVATAATAVMPTIGSFAAAQFVARLFLTAEAALAWTFVAEELPAGARGFGFGWLAMQSALGSGLGSIVYGAALAPHDISWRWLYVGALPVLVTLIYFRRRLPESGRFVAAARDGRLVAHWQPIVRPPYRRLLISVCVAALLAELTTAAGVFAIDFMQTQRGLSTTASNLILVAAGALAIPVLIFAGSLADRLGRKPVACAFLAMSLLGPLAFFFLARGAPALFAALALSFVGSFGAWPTLSAFGSEVFPTGLRALGGSSATAARAVGRAVSLVGASVLITATGSLPRAIAVLVAGPLLAAVVVAIWLPETRGRELEEIAGESPIMPLEPVPVPGPVPD